MTEEPPAGSKRARFKGYIKAANELRATYAQQYASGWNQRSSDMQDLTDGGPGAYPDAAVVTSGEEQMILFPSYARKHVRTKPEAVPGTIQERSGQGRDVRDTTGAGDAEFMKQQWEEYEEDNAVVDVDVRGWVFSPHKGQMTRRQRVFVSLARQLAGLPAPARSSPSTSPSESRDTSPHSAHRERAEARVQQRDEELASKQAEDIVKRGEAEADAASRGEYSEGSSRPLQRGREASEANSLRRLAVNNAAGTDDDPKTTPIQKRASWNQPADMSPAELAEANAHLMARLAPFMSNPLANTPISAFFYNERVSRQRTIYTDAYGHFALRAALDFVPTHVRILASEHLSATEEIRVTSPKGVSLISDIDDTIKHSAISSGAREIFRNAFIRDLGDLTVDGVQDWYSRLAKMGVQFHYVSNSPWQLYPVITKYFAMAGLPPGSFHLKQYSGIFQGIFEPVAERKKSTLDRIARDFPERRFILVGDSGEADLEVYLDFVAEYPGRVLAIMIRDVTSPPPGHRFFDSSMGPLSGERSGSIVSQRQGSVSRPPVAVDNDDDPDLKAAIAASLRSLEEEEKRNRPSLPPKRPTEPGAPERTRAAAHSEDLIDLNDPIITQSIPPTMPRSMSEFTLPISERRSSASTTGSKAAPPTVPRKPITLQTKSPLPSAAEERKKEPPPPPPPRRGTNASNASALSNSPPLLPQANKPLMDRKASTASTTSVNSYTSTAKEKLATAYSYLPAAPWNTSYMHTELSRNPSTSTASSAQNEERAPPPPPRRGVTSIPGAMATRATNAWQSYGTQGNANASGTGGPQPPVNKRLELWQQRWERAAQYCKERNVVLKSWKVGTDVLDFSVKLVEKIEKEDKEGMRKG